jgi:hypothetical protein
MKIVYFCVYLNCFPKILDAHKWIDILQLKIDFKSAHAQTIICISHLQLTYYSHQLFVGKLENE